MLSLHYHFHIKDIDDFVHILELIITFTSVVDVLQGKDVDLLSHLCVLQGTPVKLHFVLH